MKFISYIITVLFLIILTGCSDNSEIIKQAGTDGSKAAINVISEIGKDKMAAEAALLESKAKLFEYAKLDHSAAVKFDLDFKKYIIVNNDSISKIIF